MDINNGIYSLIMKKIITLLCLAGLCACGSTSNLPIEDTEDPSTQIIGDGNAYSVSKIKVREKDNIQYTNILEYIRGKVPGVVVGSDGSINIRGVNSVNSGGEPLILLDGAQINDITTVNPNDIYSINVLKDAATSIYGFRGVNGVIEIKTKTAQESLKNEKAAQKAARKSKNQ